VPSIHWTSAKRSRFYKLSCHLSIGHLLNDPGFIYCRAIYPSDICQSAHLHICTSAHLSMQVVVCHDIMTSAHLHICPCRWLCAMTSTHLHICTSVRAGGWSHDICTSAHLSMQVVVCHDKNGSMRWEDGPNRFLEVCV